MAIEGIWRIEMQGPYGWEATATAFIQDGIYRGASAVHYTVGTYTVDGNRVLATATMTTHGQPLRAMFGRKDTSFSITYEGELHGDDRLVGSATDTEAQFSIPFRAEKIADIG
jgi:hypothetical protein